MGVKDNHTKHEQETQCWWLGTSVASGGPRFQNLSKMATKCRFMANFGAQDVHGRTNQDNEQTLLIGIRWVLHPSSGVNNLFGDPKYR